MSPLTRLLPQSGIVPGADAPGSHHPALRAGIDADLPVAPQGNGSPTRQARLSRKVTCKDVRDAWSFRHLHTLPFQAWCPRFASHGRTLLRRWRYWPRMSQRLAEPGIAKQTLSTSRAVGSLAVHCSHERPGTRCAVSHVWRPAAHSLSAREWGVAHRVAPGAQDSRQRRDRQGEEAGVPG